MTQEEYERDHPDIDPEKLWSACIYALDQLRCADLKEEEDAPLSAIEHRSMAFRKLRDTIKPFMRVEDLTIHYRTRRPKDNEP